VSVTVPSPTLIRIGAIDDTRADALVRDLVQAFDAEDISFDGAAVEVTVTIRGESNNAVVRTLDAVEAWLAANDAESTTIHLSGRSYRIQPRGGVSP
jgi:hypothetical protein